MAETELRMGKGCPKFRREAVLDGETLRTRREWRRE